MWERDPEMSIKRQYKFTNNPKINLIMLAAFYTTRLSNLLP